MSISSSSPMVQRFAREMFGGMRLPHANDWLRGMDSKMIMAKILVGKKRTAGLPAIRSKNPDDHQDGVMMTVEPVSLTINADINEIPRLSDMLEEVMGESGFPDEAILDTQLAVEEVVTNVIMHGYGDAGGEIHVSCLPDADAIVIQVEDQAKPFDPLSLPEPDISADIEDRKIGGLGIFLTRQVMDDIAYRYENKKNILTLTKKRDGSS